MAKAAISFSKKNAAETSASNNAAKIMAASTTRASNSGTTITTPKNTSANTTANTKSEKLCLHGMIAKKAGVPTHGNGEPYITNKTDFDKYYKALNEYNKSNNKAAYLAGIDTSSTGQPRINSADEAKRYQNALNVVNNHDSDNDGLSDYDEKNKFLTDPYKRDEYIYIQFRLMLKQVMGNQKSPQILGQERIL